MKRSAIVVAAAAAAILAGGCADGESTQSTADGKLQVMAGFYPLAYVAQQVGGDHVEVTDLTPPGGEAHDVELSPATVSEIGKADLGLYLSGGMQPAVEEAYSSQGIKSIDGRAAIPESDLIEGDPHVWLDPTLLADIGDEVTQAFIEADPDNAADYKANDAKLREELEKVDADYSDGLSKCERQTVVTSHEAFGYLAKRYGLEQVGITGINPDAEPSPKRLRDVSQIVSNSGATTLFFESSTAPGAAQDLAETLGVDSAALNPLEAAPTDDTDYAQTMQQNLEALRVGLACK